MERTYVRCTYVPKGAFFNYVNQILPIIDHLPSDISERISLLFLKENLHTIDNSGTE